MSKRVGQVNDGTGRTIAEVLVTANDDRKREQWVAEFVRSVLPEVNGMCHDELRRLFAAQFPGVKL